MPSAIAQRTATPRVWEVASLSGMAYLSWDVDQSRRGIIDGKYELVRELGKGGMGVVYEARHLRTGGKVALKLILSDVLGRDSRGTVLRRFQREARAAASIDSQHVVQVMDTGIDEETNHPYLVMEFLAGEDLRAILRRLGPLEPDAVLRIAAQACLGLHRAHAHGIIHRDIKSANLHLAPRDGDQVIVKLLDFGIAKVHADALAGNESQHLTRSDSMLGSPMYMSPEQAISYQGLDGRSDIWSLGVVMYEALAGQTPHAGSVGAVILAICSKPAPSLRERAPWVPAEVAAIVHRALSLEPMQRFQTAMEMHAAISALLPDGSALKSSMLVGVNSHLPSTPAQAVEDATALPPPQLGDLIAPVAPSLPATQVGQATANPLTLNTDARRPTASPGRSFALRGWSFAVAAALVVVAAELGYRARAAHVAEPAHVADAVDERRDSANTPPAVASTHADEVVPKTATPETAEHGAEVGHDAGTPVLSHAPTDPPRTKPIPAPRRPPVRSVAAAISAAPAVSSPPAVVGPPMFDRTF